MLNLKWLTEDWFWSMANFLLLLATAGFVYRQVKLQWDDHLLATLKDLDDRWVSKSLMLARKKYCERWLADDHNPDPIGEFIAEFFELLAIYEKTHTIPIEIIWDTFSFYIEHYYLMLQVELRTIRISRRDPSLYEGFERLYNLVHKKSKEKYAPTIIENEDLFEFANREISIASLVLN